MIEPRIGFGKGARDSPISGPYAPPQTKENPFSVLGRSQIFLLFLKVVATGLLTAATAIRPKMVLSPPTFSKAVD